MKNKNGSNQETSLFYTSSKVTQIKKYFSKTTQYKYTQKKKKPLKTALPRHVTSWKIKGYGKSRNIAYKIIIMRIKTLQKHLGSILGRLRNILLFLTSFACKLLLFNMFRLEKPVK